MSKRYITLSEERPSSMAIVKKVSPLPAIKPSPPVVIIPGYAQETAAPLTITIPEPRQSLGDLISLGARYHDQAKPGAFVERVQIGYYAYERSVVWRTCALAAAFAGAFGPASIERPEFSYTEAVYRLSSRVGYDLTMSITDPLGITGPLAHRIIKLVDDHFWTREGVAEWVSDTERRLLSRAVENWASSAP